MSEFKPELLIKCERNGLSELEHYGFIVFCGKEKNIKTIGKTDNYPFFHRSCAKPLQAAVIEDFETKDFFNLTDEEIAVCCASHTGEEIHINILKNLLDKTGLKESDLKCPAIAPLCSPQQKTGLSPLHNNCSGKHTLMLAVCRQKGWDKQTYLNTSHPLQEAIYNKIRDLCETEKKLPETKDGCTAPNWATSLESLAKAFLNLFSDPKYSNIKKAYLKNPYLIGGLNRTDTSIMQLNQNLAAKTGANGLLAVVNTETNESLVFKIMDADMQARSIIAIETIIQMGWINVNSINKNLLYDISNKTVTTQTKEPVALYKTLFDVSRMF